MKTSQKLWKLNKRSCVFVFRKNLSLRLVREQRWRGRLRSIGHRRLQKLFFYYINFLYTVNSNQRPLRPTDEIKERSQMRSNESD